ncbi:MAG: hypothetical protein GY822_31715 [Deltaproteobacteria bacterium]|nr:hypothetical protein [Deltaproteobacteria bacterium]
MSLIVEQDDVEVWLPYTAYIEPCLIVPVLYVPVETVFTSAKGELTLRPAEPSYSREIAVEVEESERRVCQSYCSDIVDQGPSCPNRDTLIFSLPDDVKERFLVTV